MRSIKKVERTVDPALEGIDVAKEEWDEVNYQRGWRRSRSREEVRDLLVEFTRNTARTRRNQTTVPVSTDQQRLRLEREQRLAELRAERGRAEAKQRERERLAEVERRRIEAEQRERWLNRPAVVRALSFHSSRMQDIVEPLYGAEASDWHGTELESMPNSSRGSWWPTHPAISGNVWAAKERRGTPLALGQTRSRVVQLPTSLP